MHHLGAGFLFDSRDVLPKDLGILRKGVRASGRIGDDTGIQHARYLFIADRRKEARYSAFPEDEEESFPERSPAAAPFDRAAAGEEAQQVHQILSEPRHDRDRQLLLRFYFRDDSKEEICNDLEIEPECFHMLLHRARERMRELWEKREKRTLFFTGVRKFVDRIGGDPARRG